MALFHVQVVRFCTHIIRRSCGVSVHLCHFLVGEGHVRFLKVFLVYYVFDSLAFVGSDLFRLRIFKRLFWLDLEVALFSAVLVLYLLSQLVHYCTCLETA
mgnify:CR=1 FL=1